MKLKIKVSNASFLFCVWISSNNVWTEGKARRPLSCPTPPGCLVHSLIIHDAYPWEEKKVSQEAACFWLRTPKMSQGWCKPEYINKVYPAWDLSTNIPKSIKSFVYWKGRWKLELGGKEDKFHNALQSASITLSTESYQLASCKNEWQIYVSLWSWHSTRWRNPLRCGYGNHHRGHF